MWVMYRLPLMEKTKSSGVSAYQDFQEEGRWRE